MQFLKSASKVQSRSSARSSLNKITADQRNKVLRCTVLLGTQVEPFQVQAAAKNSLMQLACLRSPVTLIVSIRALRVLTGSQLDFLNKTGDLKIRSPWQTSFSPSQPSTSASEVVSQCIPLSIQPSFCQRPEDKPEVNVDELDQVRIITEFRRLQTISCIFIRKKCQIAGFFEAFICCHKVPVQLSNEICAQFEQPKYQILSETFCFHYMKPTIAVVFY